jgi:hypothetical protein
MLSISSAKSDLSLISLSDITRDSPYQPCSYGHGLDRNGEGGILEYELETRSYAGLLFLIRSSHMLGLSVVRDRGFVNTAKK